jgi:hypothetical protein
MKTFRHVEQKERKGMEQTGGCSLGSHPTIITRTTALLLLVKRKLHATEITKTAITGHGF